MAPFDVDEPILDEEKFFRRVEPNKSHYDMAHSPPKVSTMAFADREFQPSIDRSRVLVAQTFDAGYTQGVATNGVLRVKALAVRAEKIVHAERAYLADVHPDPCPPQAPTNHAHCLLKMSPAPDTKGTFRKLLERLSRMARWERLPKESIDRGDQIPPDTV